MTSEAVRSEERTKEEYLKLPLTTFTLSLPIQDALFDVKLFKNVFSDQS